MRKKSSYRLRSLDLRSAGMSVVRAAFDRVWVRCLGSNATLRLQGGPPELAWAVRRLQWHTDFFRQEQLGDVSTF